MTDHNRPPQPRTDPGVASVEHGLVVLDGPDGVAVTMTAEAARQTAANLHAAAEQALGERGAEAPVVVPDVDAGAGPHAPDAADAADGSGNA